MKRLFFLLLMAAVLIGFAPAQEGGAARVFPLDAALFGNITDYRDVTPDTVSISVPIFGEMFIDRETGTVSYNVKCVTDEAVSVTKTIDFVTLNAVYITLNGDFITGGPPLRGA